MAVGYKSLPSQLLPTPPSPSPSPPPLSALPCCSLCPSLAPPPPPPQIVYVLPQPDKVCSLKRKGGGGGKGKGGREGEIGAAAATEGDVTTAWLDVRRSKRGRRASELGREEKEVRIARGSRGCSTDSQPNYTQMLSIGARLRDLTKKWCELDATLLETEGSRVCVQQAAQTNSLSIASSTNKTDEDDDELPFHLLQHTTRHARATESARRSTPFVHVGDCVCARLKQSGKPGFQDLGRLNIRPLNAMPVAGAL